PAQRRFRIPAGRWFDQSFEIGKQRRVLGNRRFAPRSRPPNPFRRLLLRQFLQTPPDRARRNSGRRRNRRDPTITRGECLRRCDQTTPRSSRKGATAENRSLMGSISITPTTYGIQSGCKSHILLSKVDSIICGRALSIAGPGRSWSPSTSCPFRGETPEAGTPTPTRVIPAKVSP